MANHTLRFTGPGTLAPVVSGTIAVSSGAPSTNEPAGFTPIYAQDFTGEAPQVGAATLWDYNATQDILPSGGLVEVVNYDYAQLPTLNAPGYQGWRYAESAPTGQLASNMSLVSDAALSIGGDANVMRLRFGPDLSGGYMPIKTYWTGVWPANTGSFEYEFSLRFPSNWAMPATSRGIKSYFFGNNGVNNHFIGFTNVDWNSTPVAGMTLIVGLQSPFNTFYTDAVLALNTPYFVKVLGCANTPGTANGQLRVWMKGGQYGTTWTPVQINNGVYGVPNQTVRTDVQFFSAGQTAQQTKCEFAPTFAGNNESPGQVMSIDWGHFIARTVPAPAPLTGGVFRQLMPNGLAAGSQPGITRFWESNPNVISAFKCRKVYVRFKLLLPGPDFQNGSNGTKLIYFGYGRTTNDNDGWISIAGPGGSTDITPRTAFPIRCYLSHGDATSGGMDLKVGQPYDQNLTATNVLTVGVVHTVEMVLDLGTVDGNNGTLDVWCDGAKVMAHTGIPLRQSADNTAGDPAPSTYGVFNCSWVPVWNAGVPRTRDDYMYLDDVYVSGLPDGLGTPNPLALPQVDLVAPTTRLTANYTALNALDLRNKPLGYVWTDPHSGITCIKGSTLTYPHNSNKSNPYGDGGNYASHAWQNGSGDWCITHSVFSGSNQQTWLVDIILTGANANTLTNWRQLTGSLAPSTDIAFSFSANRATPRIAYVYNGGAIRRIDTQTMALANTGLFPKTIPGAWLHQDRNDEWFVTSTTGGVITAWNANTGVTRTCSVSANEGRIDREGGGYVLLTGGTARLWDAATSNSAVGPAFLSDHNQHNASMRRRWMGTNWDLSSPWGVWKASNAAGALSAVEALYTNGFYAGSEIHWAGQWDQDVNGGYDQQWGLCSGAGDNAGTWARRATGLVKADGTDARLVLFHQNLDYGSDYWALPFNGISPGGHVVSVSTKWTTGENTGGQAVTDIIFAIMPRTGGL